MGEGVLVIRELAHVWPDLFVWRAEDAEDFEKLVYFGVSWKEGFSGDHFSENASDAPHVHWSGVMPGPEQDFRGPVPQGDHFVGVCAHGYTKRPCQSEVGQFERKVPVINEQIEVFEHEVESFVVVEHIHEPDDVFVLQFLEQCDLSYGGGRYTFIFLFEPDFFECDGLSSTFVFGFVDHPIGPFPDLFNLVVLHRGSRPCGCSFRVVGLACTVRKPTFERMDGVSPSFVSLVSTSGMAGTRPPLSLSLCLSRSTVFSFLPSIPCMNVCVDLPCVPACGCACMPVRSFDAFFFFASIHPGTHVRVRREDEGREAR
eukprot:scaffold694_cov338-Pavlova_lutheri.AAC.46